VREPSNAGDAGSDACESTQATEDPAVRRFAASELGGRDSNPRYRDQNPVSYQLDDPPGPG
jgi:hypothetical protein